MPGRFFDTNLLLYLGTAAEAAKADTAEQLLREGGVVSVQVLNEIANVARRKMGLSWSETRSFLSAVHGCCRSARSRSKYMKLGLPSPSGIACRFTMR